MIATTSSGSLETARRLGADEVIDHTTTRLEEAIESVDRGQSHLSVALLSATRAGVHLTDPSADVLTDCGSRSEREENLRGTTLVHCSEAGRNQHDRELSHLVGVFATENEGFRARWAATEEAKPSNGPEARSS